MAFAYFISQDYLKKYTPIDGNVDQKVLNPVIRTAQELHIKPLLGTDLYNRLITDCQNFQTSGTALAANYATLLNDYIRPALKEWVVYESLYILSYKIRSNGVIVQGNEGGNPVSDIQMAKIEDKFHRNAKIQTEILYDWLCANSDLFAEYSDNADDGDRYPTGFSKSYGGLWLGMSQPKNCDDQ